jgi:hypothetical protein
MSLTAGVISLTAVQSNAAQLVVTAASGGTGPYTQQWYRSESTGFSPGAGNLISGATGLSLNDTGLIPNSIMYYKVVFTDTGNSNITVTATQLAVTTLPSALSQNQFAQSPTVGMVDLPYDYNTIAAQIDSSQATALYQGMAVKIVNSAGGVPKVVGCAANSDDVFGFINFNLKNVSFQAGDACEISQSGNVMWLYATAAIARGTQVQLDILSAASVAPKTGSSGADIVGFSLDKAAAFGDLIRVRLSNPSFLKA